MKAIEFLEEILEELKKKKEDKIIFPDELQEVLPEDFKYMTFESELTLREKIEKIVGSLSKEVKELREEVKIFKEDRYSDIKDDIINIIDEYASNYDNIKFDLEQFLSDYAWDDFTIKIEKNYEEVMESLKSRLIKLLAKA